QLETTNSALANHAKSRNHPDASLTAKGFVQLYSGVMSDSEILAATPKAVKIAMDNANARLAKDQNLADLTNVPLARQSLQLGNSATLNTGTTTGTVAAGDDSRITGAMQKSQNGADVPDKPAFLQNVGAFPVTGGRLNGPLGIGTDNVLGGNSIVLGDNDTGFKQDGDGVLSIYANNARVGYIDGNGLHMLTDIHFDNARMTNNGDIFSSVWGNNWLSIWITNQLNTRGTIDWINSELAVRDNNINARATIDYVNQTFARKNTASLAVNGWFRDESTGWIFQWGITPFAGNTTITVSLPIPFPVQGFLALGGPASALWYGEDDNSSYAALLNNSQLQVTTDTNVGTAWIVMGH
ncbi:tail fiber protein, partial [Salmonella enterica]|nr:tail fiber protein [Salmonella enterica]